MTTAKAVANFFLEKAWAEGLSVDQLKLQKLVYYSYAWYLAHDAKQKKNKTLFQEDICAWPHGPVIEDLYKEFRDFGRSSINCLAKSYDWNNCKVEIPQIGVDEKFERKLLDAVWDKYKNLSGVQLSNMTHGADEPWTVLKDTCDISDRPIISDDLIKAKFQPRLKKPNKETASE